MAKLIFQFYNPAQCPDPLLAISTSVYVIVFVFVFSLTKYLCFSPGVRLDRVRGGRQKYKRSPEQPPVAITQSTPVKKQCIESKYINLLLGRFWQGDCFLLAFKCVSNNY